MRCVLDCNQHFNKSFVLVAKIPTNILFKTYNILMYVRVYHDDAAHILYSASIADRHFIIINAHYSCCIKQSRHYSNSCKTE